MPTTMESNQNNLNNKSTIFRLTLEKISFKYDGMFILKLTVINSVMPDKSGIRLRTKDSEKFLKDFSVRSEVIGPLKKDTFANFDMDEYSFYLPKGFCKNDIDHDVYLLIEVLQVAQDAKTQVIGTVKLPIYPRSDIKANYKVERGEPFYVVRGSMRLLRPNIKESNLHCGDLFYKSEFCEIMEILEPEVVQPVKLTIKSPEPPLQKKISPPPTKRIIDVSSSPIDSIFEPSIEKPNQDSLINFGISPPKTPDIAIETIPLPENSHTMKNIYNLLSPKDLEEISIFIRGGENIMSSQQLATKTYVTCILKTDEAVSDSTHVVNSATSNPLWEEILNLQFTPEKIDRILSIRIIDHSASTVIAEFVLPIKSLEPFFHHHLKLCQAFPLGNMNPTLYVTIIRKLDHYPLTGKEHAFSVLIVKPLALYSPLHSIRKYPTICFCYLSNDKSQQISKNVQSLDDNFVEVHSPVPSNYSYTHNKKHPMWSCGQLSIPSNLQREYDAWNFPFLFCQKTEIDTAFTANSFIVLDFYSVPSSAGMSWKNNPPMAQSILKLDKLLFRQLQDRDKCLINIYDFEMNWKQLSLWTDDEVDVDLRNFETKNELSIKVVLSSENVPDGIYPESEVPQITKKKEVVELSKKKNTEKKFEKEPFLYKIRSLRTPPDQNNAFIENESKPRHDKDFLYQNSLRQMQLELTNLRKHYNALKVENEGLENNVIIKKSKGKNNYRQHSLEIENLSKIEIFQKYDKLHKRLGTQMSLLSEARAKEKDLRTKLSSDIPQDSSNNLYTKLKLTNENLQKLEIQVKDNEKIISRLETSLEGKETYQETLDEKNAVDDNQYYDNERNQLYDLIERSENRIKMLQNELIDISRKRGARKQMMKIREMEKLSNFDSTL